MSVSNAINAASMGLRTTQTLSAVTAENVANATTEGYTRRKGVVVSGAGAASGPVVSEVRREVDNALTRMSRNEMGKQARHEAVFVALNNYTVYFGQPGDGLSPAEKFTEFDTSLTTLANMPASSEAQLGVALAADDLAASIRGASGVLAAVRADVEMEIRYEVSELNQAIYDLAALNKRVVETQRGTPQWAQLGDQMDDLVDKIAGIVDVRVYTNTDGSYNLFTSGGTALLERTQMQDVTYDPSDGTLRAGLVDITTNKPGVRGLTEGSLAGLLELKRGTIPKFQSQLDEYARGLITAFEAADASLTSGDAGLFTDGGMAYDPANQEFLASRIQVNDAIRQNASGEYWRIRDGLGAATEGTPSDSTQIQAFIDALDDPLNAASTTGLQPTISIADYGTEMVSAQGNERARSQERALDAQSTAEIVIASRQSFEGVNLDEEMQDLQMIQQSYAANSQVLTTALRLIDTLLAAF